jgi:hypothetical protein
MVLAEQHQFWGLGDMDLSDIATNHFHPRVTHIDVLERESYLQLLLVDIDKDLRRFADPKPELIGRWHSSLASSFLYAATTRYALGYPFSDIRTNLGMSAHHALESAKLRGTGEPFPVLLVTIDGRYEPNDPRATISKDWKDPPGTKDYDSPPAANTLLGYFSARLAGDDELANLIIPHIWDARNRIDTSPSDRRYTAGDRQCIAYAVKDYLRGDLHGMEHALKKVNGTKQWVDCVHQKKMLRTIVARDKVWFLTNLEEHLQWNARLVKRKNSPRPGPINEYYLCLPALGLSLLALNANVITVEDLPTHDPHFPLELLIDSSASV